MEGWLISDTTSILPGVKHVILVMSGKGGVGKSTVAVQLALALRSMGNKVGLLDVDLCGPSIPKMLNLEGKSVHQCAQGWVPVFADTEQTLAVMSIGFLLADSNSAVIWRGPKKTALIKQFLTEVCWTDIDYLIIDTPPGTSDEHITVAENLKKYKPDGAVLVTTPQNVAVGDVRREVTFCKKTGINILGVIENMSGYVCPHCSECSPIFSSEGGEALAKHAGIPFLGRVPLDPQLSISSDTGQSFLEMFPQSAAATAFKSIVENLVT